MKIIVPKDFIEIDPDYGPPFFFVGPVRGGGDWQKSGVGLIRKRLERFYAAIPYYHRKGEHAYPLLDIAEKPDPNPRLVFPRQLDWERYYITEALTKGCLICFCPEESKDDPRPADGGPYACDTRGELARYSVECKYNPDHKMVTGVEPGFHGRSQIERNHNMDRGLSDPLFTTLEETIEKAVDEGIANWRRQKTAKLAEGYRKPISSAPSKRPLNMRDIPGRLEIKCPFAV